MSEVTRCLARNRPYFVGRPCGGKCGRKFAATSPVVVVEEKVNWFRGDDEVTAYCPDCYAARESRK